MHCAQIQLQLGDFLGDSLQFFIHWRGSQLLLLSFQFLLARQTALDDLFQLLDTRLLDFGNLPWFFGTLVKLIPLLLPALHHLLRLGQRLGGDRLLLPRLFQHGVQLFQLRFQFGNAFEIHIQLFTSLFPAFFGLGQVEFELVHTFDMVLDGLLDAGNVIAEAVVARLYLTQLVIEVGVFGQMLFDVCIQCALVGGSGFDLQLELTDLVLIGLDLTVEAAPFQRIEVGRGLPFFLFQLAILLRRH